MPTGEEREEDEEAMRPEAVLAWAPWAADGAAAGAEDSGAGIPATAAGGGTGTDKRLVLGCEAILSLFLRLWVRTTARVMTTTRATRAASPPTTIAMMVDFERPAALPLPPPPVPVPGGWAGATGAPTPTGFVEPPPVMVTEVASAEIVEPASASAAY